MQYVTVVLPLIVIMGVGWTLRRLRVIKGDNSNLEGMLYWGVLPALIFRSIFYSGGFAKETTGMPM